MPALIRVLLGALLLTCLVTPWAYDLVLAIWPDPIPPFRRVFDRIGMLILLVLIVVERKNLGLARVRAYLAHERFAGGASSFLRGLLLSLLCGAAVAPLILARPDVTRTGMSAATLAWRCATDLPGAVVVGLLEECLFRVVVLEALRRSFRIVPAVALTTLFYASVHFLRPSKEFVYESSPFAGLRYIGAVGERALNFDFAWPFIGLVLVGSVLACALLRSGSLWLCIGLHAGWFLVHKLGIRGLDTSPMSAPGLGEERWNLLTIPWSWLSIALVGAFVVVLTRPARVVLPLSVVQSTREDDSRSLGTP